MNFPQYLISEEKIFTVLGEIEDDNTRYKNHKGYICGDKIYIYVEGKPEDKEAPYFWIEDGKINYSEPKDKIKDKFNVDKLQDLSTKKIIDSSHEDDVLYDEEVLNDMNSANSSFEPKINEEDDFLKKVIKTALIEKGINLKRLQKLFPKKHGLSNLKSSLMNKTKMSPLMYGIWIEILGLDFELTVYDNGTDIINPLKNSVTYISNENRIIVNKDGEDK